MKDVLLYLFGLPGIFCSIFLLVIFYIATERYRKAKITALVLLAVVMIFSNMVVGKFLSSFLIEDITFKQIKSMDEIDLIVMPTQGIEYNGRIIGWLPNEESFKAATISYDLQSRLADRKVPLFICGGQIEGNNTDISEASVIKEYFTRKTTLVRKTLIEDISKNLYEQVWQCSNMIKKYNAKNPVLVINELKMLRTLALFRARGVEMIPFPVFVVNKEQSVLFQFLPSLEGLMLNRSLVREYIEIAADFINQRINMKNLSYTNIEEGKN